MSVSTGVNVGNKALVLWVRLNTYLVFKGSPTCRLSSWMWARVAAAVHIVTMCSYVLFFFFQQVRTGDLGGYATSDEFTRAVIANLAVWARCLQTCQLLRCTYAHWPAILTVYIVRFRKNSHMFHAWMYKMLISNISGKSWLLIYYVFT